MGVKPRGRGCTGSTNNHLAVIVRPFLYIYMMMMMTVEEDAQGFLVVVVVPGGVDVKPQEKF